MLGFFGNMNNPVADGVLFGETTLNNNVGGTGAIERLEISNCTARYLYVNNNMNENPQPLPPTTSQWDNYYIMQDDFTENLQGGNINAVLEGLTALLIKRRKKSGNIRDYITVFNIPITGTEEEKMETLKNIQLKDFSAQNNEDYYYSIVPLLVNGDIIVEGSITEEGQEEAIVEVHSEFDDVFVCDKNQSYKLFGNIQYDGIDTVQLTGAHQTLGSKYPIIVSNSKVNYHISGISATVLNKEYVNGSDRELNRTKLRLAYEDFDKFITNKTPKIIKDLNGNIWMCMITDNITFTPNNSWMMGLGDVHFNWTEIGNPNSEKDLSSAGFIDVENMAEVE